MASCWPLPSDSVPSQAESFLIHEVAVEPAAANEVRRSLFMARDQRLTAASGGLAVGVGYAQLAPTCVTRPDHQGGSLRHSSRDRRNVGD